MFRHVRLARRGRAKHRLRGGQRIDGVIDAVRIHAERPHIARRLIEVKVRAGHAGVCAHRSAMLLRRAPRGWCLECELRIYRAIRLRDVARNTFNTVDIDACSC
jgi:hypothetical protein